MVVSICLSVCLSICLSKVKVKVRCQGQRLSSRSHFSTGAEWSIVVLGFAKYSIKSNETQVRYTLKKHHRELISRGVKNNWAFKMVVVSTGCTLAVDHAFNVPFREGFQDSVRCVELGFPLYHHKKITERFSLLSLTP